MARAKSNKSSKEQDIRPVEPVSDASKPVAAVKDHAKGQYVVVARRYRPQGFSDLVGQEMVSRALSNAIETDRVGHAYLFTGARGVGKTSTARIFSKALNCAHGPTPTPCHQCDICESIASGDDVDVLEIDGASNRGIDEIRQLRSNVSVRPSRSRYKIYIIDEVHMLTKEAFNALLKTLEEPPRHVKFIFCTTDPEKIPITVLSRCQRFDFSPVEPQAIVERLQFIVDSEGSSADPEALRLLARRAAGSMRDSQSLLEQLLSFTSERITEQAVHDMLGTAGAESLYGVLDALAKREAGKALREFDAAVGNGVDAGQLAEQLLGCMRDLLALSVGAGEDMLLYTSPADVARLRDMATQWGTHDLLAAAEILDHAIGRMRVVMHSRLLLETALIRIASLQDLQDLADLIAQLKAGMLPQADVTKKKRGVANEALSSPSTLAATKESYPSAEITSAVSTEGYTASSSASTPARKDRNSADAPPAPIQAHLDPLDAADLGRQVASTKLVGRPNQWPPVADTSSDVPDNFSTENEFPLPSEEAENHHETPLLASSPSSAEKSQVLGDKADEIESNTNSDAKLLWQSAIEQLDGISADFASHFESARFDNSDGSSSSPPSANFAPNRLVVTFPAMYTSSKSFCQRPERHGELERIVSQLAGRKVKVEFSLRHDQAHKTPSAPVMSARQRERQVVQHPFVQRAVELFSASVTSVTQGTGNRAS